MVREAEGLLERAHVRQRADGAEVRRGVRVQAADGTTLADFSREMVRTFEERKLTKLIVDVRCNGGGDNTTFRPLITALQTPSIDRPGVLFGLIGRATFSARATS